MLQLIKSRRSVFPKDFTGKLVDRWVLFCSALCMKGMWDTYRVTAWHPLYVIPWNLWCKSSPGYCIAEQSVDRLKQPMACCVSPTLVHLISIVARSSKSANADQWNLAGKYMAIQLQGNDRAATGSCQLGSYPRQNRAMEVGSAERGWLAGYDQSDRSGVAM